MYFYNPIDTPVEDLVMQDMVKRLKLVRSRRTNKSELILAEDGKFVSQLKVLLDQVAKHKTVHFL
jgi:hypothetical protein